MAKRYEKKKEAARMVRQQQEREQKRKQMLLGGLIVGVVLVLGAVVAIGLYLNQSAPVNQPKAKTKDGGLVLSEGPVRVDLYEDFICPVCNTFNQQFGEQINSYAAEGKIEMIFHPLGLLDSYSSTKYSSRAAAASVCAADEGKFLEYEKTLFANQPAEGSEGLPDSKIISLGTDIGLGKTFKKCVEDDTYRGWVDEITNNATGKGITSTPTLMIDGKTVEDRSKFIEQLDAAIEKTGGSTKDSDKSAEPTDSAKPSDEGKKDDEDSSEGN